MAGTTSRGSMSRARRSWCCPMIRRCPTPMIRPGATPEHLLVEPGRIIGVGHLRIIGQHHERLALDIEPLEVVPAILRRDHAVADEDELRALDPDIWHLPRRTSQEIVSFL